MLALGLVLALLLGWSGLAAAGTSPNDTCDTATGLGPGTYTVTGSLAGANNDASFVLDEPQTGPVEYARGPDLVFRFGLRPGESLTATAIIPGATPILYRSRFCYSHQLDQLIESFVLGGDPVTLTTLNFRDTPQEYYLFLDTSLGETPDTFQLLVESEGFNPVAIESRSWGRMKAEFD